MEQQIFSSPRYGFVTIYEKDKNKDGFLYIIYSSENKNELN